MILFLNSAQKGRVEVAVMKEKQGKREVVARLVSRARSDKTLALIEKLFQNKQISPRRIKKILVAIDPEGPWTAQRISQAIANTFGYVLGIKVEEVELKNKKIYLS